MDDASRAGVTIPKLQAGKPEITMAPLIDIVFLLLIFFMVTTVFPDNRGLVIEKPETKQAESLPQEHITFVIDKDGSIFHKNASVSIDDVERLVREMLAAQPDTTVMLQVDKRASTEVLIKTMDACKLGGARQVGIATDVDEQSA